MYGIDLKCSGIKITMKVNIPLLVSENISYAQEQSPIYKHIQGEHLQKKMPNAK